MFDLAQTTQFRHHCCSSSPFTGEVASGASRRGIYATASILVGQELRRNLAQVPQGHYERSLPPPPALRATSPVKGEDASARRVRVVAALAGMTEVLKQ